MAFPVLLHISHEDADCKLEPVPLLLFAVQPAEDQFAGVHEACKHFVPVARDITEFVSLLIEDENGQSVIRVFRLAPQNEDVFQFDHRFECLEIQMARTGYMALQQKYFTNKGERQAMMIKRILYERQQRGINAG